MMGLGFAEILVLAIMSGGISNTDLVTLVQPGHYFKSRQIDISVDKAIAYAGDEAKTAKQQIVQLTALRYLMEESETLKKSPKYAAQRQVLEQIASGKKANDSQGFAQEYAAALLAKLDDTKAADVKYPPLRADILNWFPADVALAMAVDFRQTRKAGTNDTLKNLLKLMPEHGKQEMYDHIEKSGNIRVERIAFAMVPSEKREEQKMYLRFTGKGNHAWVVDLIKMMDKNRGRLEIESLKDEKDTPITLVKEKFSPMIAIVGNTDVVVAGFDRPQGKDRDVFDALMDVRAKKKANAFTGVLKARLAKVPDKAIAFIVGDAPEFLKRELRLSGFEPVPTNITAWAERAQQGMDVQVETSTANGDDANKLVRKVGDLRKQGIDQLKQLMQQGLPPDAPPIPFPAIINLLETLQVQSDRDRVNVRLFVPDGLADRLLNGWILFAGARELK